MLLRVRSKSILAACAGIILAALVYYQTREASTSVDDKVYRFHLKIKGHSSLNPVRQAQHRKFLDYTRSVLDQNLGPEELLKRTLHNEEWKRSLYGTIWPKDDYNETEIRTEQQIEFLDLYREIKNRTGGVKKPKIIFGYGWFNMHSFLTGKTGQEMFINDGCPENWCIATRDNIKHELTADAVVFTHTYTPNATRNPNQIWIAQQFESPYHNRIHSPTMRYQVNWTITYRREATVVINYGTYQKNKSAVALPYINYALNKTKQAAILVSNCGAKNDRMEFARELGQFIHVDIYGRCGPYQCGVPGSSTDCVRWLSLRYKFYLSFENSNCKDYITEKFLVNALLNNILPVVYGAKKSDYEAITPPNSFIYAKDFPSVRALADYLLMLDKNDHLYNEYFRWKGTYYMMDNYANNLQRHWCRVCTLLHLQSDVGYVHSLQDYYEWWQGACNDGGYRPPLYHNQTKT